MYSCCFDRVFSMYVLLITFACLRAFLWHKEQSKVIQTRNNIITKTYI